jgi:NAD(P)-dependent dehydrogenase (short-subunit alcohol dehydrogenase family)
MAGRLQDQVALVTGAASGLAKATALRLAGEGARIVIFDRDEENAAGSQQEIEKAGGVAHVVIGDTTNEADTDRASAAAAGLGSLDILVNAAGITGRKKLLEMAPEVFKNVIGTNLIGYWMMIHASVPHMKTGGRIVQIASIAGHIGYSDSAYGASKAGVLGLTKQLALELGPRGIRINSVSPGVVYKTRINQDALDVPAVRDDAIAHVPLGRLATPGDIANAILFFVLPESGYISGADLVVDGGMTSYIGRIDANAAIGAWKASQEAQKR